MDVLSSSNYNSEIAWYENNGDGVFGAPQIIATSADGYTSLQASDLDGDGDQDIVSGLGNDQKIAWFDNGCVSTITCSDGIQNGDETGVDCGGTDCTFCITFYADNDDDTYGDANTSILAATALAGYVTDNTDCDDSDANEYPGQSWYIDADGDGYSAGAAIEQCDRPVDGYVLSELLGTNDCDDADPDEFPGQTWFIDADGDQYSAGTMVVQCERPTNGSTGSRSTGSSGNSNNDAIGFLLSELAGINDCNDSDALEYPGQQWYMDADGDGYSVGAAIEQCERPLNGYILSELTGTDDCDDTNPNAHTGQPCFASCSDGIQNGDETGVDCGGINCPPCPCASPGFTSSSITSSADGATSVYAADLDGDGNKDVLSASYYDAKIAWYKNDGNGNLGAQQIITTSAAGAQSVYAADLDGDGDLDVLLAAATDDKVSWFENDGSGNFGAEQTITTSVDVPLSVYAKDLDGDGDFDVLSASQQDQKIAWYENDGSGNFGPQQVITTSVLGVFAVYASDLDGDGDMDVLSASASDDKIAWYENDGSGNFGAQQIITSSADHAMSVYTSDLDGDGDFDVLSASSNDDKIAWYENDGSGNFGMQQVITTAADGAQSVYATDLDEDGDQDVLSASNKDDKIAWYENDGSGNFGIQRVITVSADGAQSIYATDLDGDGDMDVLSASLLDDKIAWYENDCAGTCPTPENITITYDCGGEVVLDWDITDPDTLVQSYSVTIDTNGQEFTSYTSLTTSELTIPAGTLQPGTNYEYTITGSCGADTTGVIDGTEIRDPLPEITISNVVQPDCQGNDAGGFDVTVTEDCGAFYDISVGATTFFNVPAGATVTFIDLEGTPTGMTHQVNIALADAGLCDLSVEEVVCLNAVTASELIYTADASPPNALCTNTTVFFDASGQASINPQDVDGGSTDDCATVLNYALDQAQFTCSDAPEVMVQLEVGDGNPATGSGTCMAAVTLIDDLPPSAVCQDLSIDLDGSGMASISPQDVDGGSTDNCGVVNLTLNITQFSSADIGQNQVTLTAEDAAGNSNSCSAIVTVNGAPPNCSDGIQNGDETGVDCGGSNCLPCAVPCADPGFTSNTITTSAAGASSVYALDLDGDGDADVLSASRDDDKVAWYENDGNGNFGAQQVITTLADYVSSVYASDLDGDGDADVLSASRGDDKIAWYENDGSGNFGNQQVITTLADYALSVYAKDLDGDGDMDVLSASTNDNKIAWYENDGSGNFGDQQVITISAEAPESVYAVDLDGDGDADVLSASRVDDKIAWYENDGSGNFGVQQVISTVADGARSVYALDLDGDGDADVLSASWYDDKIAWYENDGNGSFGVQQVITTAVDDARSVYATDLDGDGDTDVLSASWNDDKIAWYENDGSGNFGVQQVITTSADVAQSVYAMDLDGDGDADVLSASLVDNKIAWYENECTDTQNCLSENTLKITTIQPAPPLVLDENGEWFTVYNPTDSVVDLNGYTILDDGTDSHSITTSLLLPAGGSITLGNNADTLTNGGVHIDYSYGSDITLDDAEDEIVLVCSGTEVARAVYSGGLFAGCTNPTVALGADGTVSITPAQVEDGTMALDGLAGLWLDVTDFDCSNQGQDNLVELTVVDTDGDTSTCMANVSVIDNMAPTAVCADVTIALDSAGMALLVADSLDGGSTDNCATNFTYEASQVAFSCDDLGEQSVTLTVSDGSPDAESGNCTATVTVVDDAAPVAECQDAAVQLDAAGMATLSPEAVNNGSYDNCTPAADLVLEVSQDQFDCGDLGQQTVSLFVNDGSPNSGSGSCMAMVTVEDLLPPQAECMNTVVQLDENGTAFLPAFNVDGGSSDNCGTLDLAISQSSFDCTHLGENAVDMIVTDGSNNMDTCMAIVTVEDMILPQAICQPFSVSLDSTGSASITADNVDGGSTDNCGGLSLMLSQSTFGCGDIGSNTVTLTVTDASNNSAACQAAVTVTDDLPPEALCTDISVALDSLGQAMITTDLIDGASYDNCGLPELSLSQSQFDCSHLGANQVVLTATDGSNNSDSCTAIVTVEDLTPPEAICSPLTIQLDNMGMATLSAAAVGGSSMDNCVTVDIQLNQTSFDCSHLGQNTVSLTVTDGSNNTDLCTANITVQDLVPPTASCEPLILLELDPSGEATLSAAEVDAGSLDNCEVADLSLNQTAFSCTDLGMQTVELTVTDDSGNTSACTTELQITDVSKPLALCQDIEVELGPDGTATLQGSSLDGGSLDNCGVATLTPNPAQLTCEDIGFNTVILTVADASGNFSTCVSSVSLSDNTPPNAVCVPSLILEVDPEHDSPEIISSVDLDAGSSDNCGIAQLQVDPFAFTCQDIGAATPVTLTVIDDNGLESSCTSMVTVVNALEGQACDDGDDCTENDIYDANCNCAGTLIDEDNNGVCDFNECTSPINLHSSNITANTADLSWTAVGPAVEYLVRYRINGGGALNALATSESITLTGLPGGAQIEWRVRAICSSGQSSFSIVDAFMTLENTCPDEDDDGVCDENDLCPGLDDDLIGQPCDDGDPCTINDTYGSDCGCYGALFDENNNGLCDLDETGCLAPENLQVLGITPNMSTLTWDAVVGANSYRVGYITQGQSGTVMIVNTNMVTLTGLSPESEYLWQVRANCDMTNSDNTVGPAFTTSATGCPDADGDGVCDGDDQCPDFDDMLIGTSCNDYDNCTTNDVVTAECECVGTLIDNNNNDICDLDELCAPPATFVTNALSPASGTVAWDPVPGAVAYQLQYLIAGYGMGNTQLSDTIYTFEGLPPGSIIQWRVKTICTSGSSSWEVGPALPLPNSLNGGGGVELRTSDRLPPVDWEQVSRELSELQFDIFPNPARDEASLVLSRQAEGTEAVVYNLWGQELARYSLSGIQVQMLNVTEWRAQNTAVVVVLFEPGQPPKTKKLLLVR